MKEINDYGKVFETLIEKTKEYVLGNNLHAMVLGISGGIDSTVVAAICHEVSKRTAIPLIGRSLLSKYNKEGEITTADLVGKAFCNDYKVFNINDLYHSCVMQITHKETGSTKYTIDDNGNICPMEDDINIMHRYRDSIVSENKLDNNFKYESIGAYVMFPCSDEESFKENKFYKVYFYFKIVVKLQYYT